MKNGKAKLAIDPETGMLPPVNELTVQPEGSSAEVVRQQKLRAFYDAAKALRSAKVRYYNTYREVQHMIMGGAEIQEGKYGVRHGIKLVRRRSYKNDVIDLKGEQYQIRLLESTQPHAEFYWRLVTPKK